ncbi:MAG TPA: hypothetical protein VFE31_07100 [Opitutaceae bacterium]|jgi:OFA family oxalate/formate antiporter-like MFS transporter|nr:hypothetical protein [Opitutaceae bacterium]
MKPALRAVPQRALVAATGVLMAIAGGVFYSLGRGLAGHAGHHLLPLTIDCGLWGGLGLGFGYVLPSGAMIKWFPGRRGTVAGLAAAGFGAEPILASRGVPPAAVLFIAILILASAAAVLRLRIPGLGRAGGPNWAMVGQALRSWQWYALWGILFLNSLAGFAILSQIAPLAQAIAHVSAATTMGIAGTLPIADCAGRLLGPWLSDAVGRAPVYVAIFVAQTGAFLLLSRAASSGALIALTCLIVLCYGGALGTLPALVADYFGSGNVAPLFGLILTAWLGGGFLGPKLISLVHQCTGQYEPALELLAGSMLMSAALAVLIRPPTAQAQSRSRPCGS